MGMMLHITTLSVLFLIGINASVCFDSDFCLFARLQPYMAPELVRDLPYDESVDLWAVGVLTFELLHGYTPFK